MEGRQSSVLSHVCNNYLGSLSYSPSKYVGDVRKGKKKKKKINGQTCLQYAYVCACVYKYTDTCVYKKGKRWVSKRTGRSVLTCTDMYYVCAPTGSIKKINSTSLSQNLFSFIQIYLNPHTYFSINKHMLN